MKCSASRSHRSMLSPIVLITSIMVVLFAAMPKVWAEPPTTAQNAKLGVHRWGVVFQPVPSLLKQHCMPLRFGHGLVVESVGDDFGGSFSLQPGDVLLSVAGVPVTGTNSLPAAAPPFVVVMRQGQIVPLGTLTNTQPIRFPFNLEQMAPTAANVFAGPGQPPNGQVVPGVTANAFSSGNESISVSKNGNQIVLEMYLPKLQPSPIRLRGTRQQIEQEVRGSNLAPAARRRVLEAIK